MKRGWMIGGYYLIIVGDTWVTRARVMFAVGDNTNSKQKMGIFTSVSSIILFHEQKLPT